MPILIAAPNSTSHLLCDVQALTMYATEIAIVNAANLGSTLLASGSVLAL